MFFILSTAGLPPPHLAKLKEKPAGERWEAIYSMPSKDRSCCPNTDLVERALSELGAPYLAKMYEFGSKSSNKKLWWQTALKNELEKNGQ